jgi:hypothetical protein
MAGIEEAGFGARSEREAANQWESDLAHLLAQERPMDEKEAKRLAIDTKAAWDHVKDRLQDDKNPAAEHAINILARVHDLAMSHLEDEDHSGIYEAARDQAAENAAYESKVSGNAN